MFEMNPKEWLYIVKVRHVWYKRDGQGILERDEGQKMRKSREWNTNQYEGNTIKEEGDALMLFIDYNLPFTLRILLHVLLRTV